MIVDRTPQENAAVSFERPGLSFAQGRYNGFNPLFAGNQPAVGRAADWNWLSLYFSTAQSALQTGAVPTGGKLTNESIFGLYLPDMTQGSVLFAGAGGLVTQNNSSFFWDNTNLFLKTGRTVASPGGQEHLRLVNIDSTQTTTFGIGQCWFPNSDPGHTRDDAMLFIGYNANYSTGGALVGTEPGWWIQLETYETTTTPGVPYCEYWVNYQPIGGGGNVRPFGARVNRSTSHCVASVAGDIVQVLDSTQVTQGINCILSSTTWAIGIGTVPNTNDQFHVKGKQLWESVTGAADNKFWDIDYGAGSNWNLRAVNDAYSTANSAISIARSGATISSITLGATCIGVNGTASNPTICFSSETNTGWYRAAASTISLSIGATQRHQLTSNTYSLLHDSAIFIMGASSDCRFQRDAANVFAIVNSNNAQTFRTYAGNGANLGIVTVNESLTIAAAASTDSTTTIPAGAVILAVAVRVTTVIPTAATFTVTAATGGATFDTAAVSTAANSTDAGTAAGPLYTAAGTKVRITPNINPAAGTGVVRLAIMYYLSTPPTS